MKPPTYLEIAQACGVASSTVSRALNRHASIPQATRERIQAQAEKMGWRPNPLAAAYMTHIRGMRRPKYVATVAFLIPFASRKHLSGYFELAMKGAEQRASSQGYKLEPIWYKDLGYQPQRLARLLKNRGIPGLVLNARDLPEGAFADFAWGDFSVAAWGTQPPGVHLHFASHHYLGGMRLLLEALRARGYRRIALMLSRLQDRLSDDAFFAAFYYEERHHSRQEWLRSYRLPKIEADAYTVAERKHLAAWLRQNQPDVVIGEQAVWSLLPKLGWRVPEDIAFASPFWSPQWPRVAGVDQLPSIVGANALDLVASQLVRNERGVPDHPKLLHSEGRWVDGPTVPEEKLKKTGRRAVYK